jgi:hypothetical protein
VSGPSGYDPRLCGRSPLDAQTNTNANADTHRKVETASAVVARVASRLRITTLISSSFQRSLCFHGLLLFLCS